MLSGMARLKLAEHRLVAWIRADGVLGLAQAVVPDGPIARRVILPALGRAVLVSLRMAERALNVAHFFTLSGADVRFLPFGSSATTS